MSTGYVFPWEQAAMRGDELPEGLGLPDQMAYTALRNLYEGYHRGVLSRDAAAAEKQRIRRSYEQACESLAFGDRLANYRARQFRDTEAAKTTCRKDPTAENALRLCDALDGLRG